MPPLTRRSGIWFAIALAIVALAIVGSADALNIN